MKALTDPIEFEWDEGNKEKNEKRHGVTLIEVEQSFSQILYRFGDEKHSIFEQRYGVYAQTQTGRKLVIVFTTRGDRIRVIMARDLSRKERRDYEKVKKNTSL